MTKREENFWSSPHPPHKETSRPLGNRSKISHWGLINNGNDPQKERIDIPDNRSKTTKVVLQCRVKRDLKRLRLADIIQLQEQTDENILQSCLHLETIRQQFLPGDTQVDTSPWGQTVKLQHTFIEDFLVATDLKILDGHHTKSRIFFSKTWAAVEVFNLLSLCCNSKMFISSFPFVCVCGTINGAKFNFV